MSESILKSLAKKCVGRHENDWKMAEQEMLEELKKGLGVKFKSGETPARRDTFDDMAFMAVRQVVHNEGSKIRRGFFRSTGFGDEVEEEIETPKGQQAKPSEAIRGAFTGTEKDWLRCPFLRGKTLGDHRKSEVLESSRRYIMSGSTSLKIGQFLADVAGAMGKCSDDAIVRDELTSKVINLLAINRNLA